MTLQELIAETSKAGIVLVPMGDRLRVKAPAGALTPELRAELTANKPALLDVLLRLDGMRANERHVPVPCVVREAVGGPGACFSCGEPLDYLHAYGRCAPCSIAAELFWSAKGDARPSA